jgi:hypothetical protein
MISKPNSKVEAGKNRPGDFAFFDPGPQLANSTKESGKSKTLCPTRRMADLSAEGSAQPILRSQPRRLGPGSSPQARPRGGWSHLSMLGLALELRGKVKQPLSRVGSVGRF